MVRDFALEAARKYLQSVVFVDDEIYYEVLAKGVEVDVAGPGGAKGMQIFAAKPLAPKVDEVVEAKPAKAKGNKKAAEGSEIYHPKNLVESFARERMVCALYEPEKDFPTDKDSEIFKLCERADAVILDWEFHKEPGKKILPLIAGLVSSAQTTVPHHVRLCAIYTSTPDLKKIASQVYDYLHQQKLEVEPDGDYKINAGSSRIVVLGKPSTGRPKDQVTAAQVAETDLANRIIEEFADMHEGILPSMALHGLASVRSNSKKILDKFRGQMDGAFLVHRGLILPDDDAFEQIPELLAEEALAVMMDSQVSAEKAKGLAEEAIDSYKIKTNWKAKGNGKAADGELAVKMLKGGPGTVRKRVDLDVAAVQQLHDELDKSGTSAKERFAALYTSRTSYGGKRPLTFGTIVRRQEEGEDPEFLVCLMPLCDCVRLKKDQPYRFPFWRLRIENNGASSKGVVVELPEGGFVELFSLGKPRDQLWAENFVAGTAKMVMAVRQDEKFVFKGEATTLEWIAQLKPAHAQRIAQDIGTSLSRVGVLEAEWLRRKADRQ